MPDYGGQYKVETEKLAAKVAANLIASSLRIGLDPWHVYDKVSEVMNNLALEKIDKKA